jgi:hypothetical protein
VTIVVGQPTAKIARRQNNILKIKQKLQMFCDTIAKVKKKGGNE